MNYEELDHETLRKLRPHVGEVARERIDAVLLGPVAPLAGAASKSSDPRDRMNQTERRMADLLDMRKRAGELREWWFDDMSFRIGVERTSYKPDFAVETIDGKLELIEVKGKHIWDDARVKFQVAAREFRFARWRMVQWKDDDWKVLYDYAPEIY